MYRAYTMLVAYCGLICVLLVACNGGGGDNFLYTTFEPCSDDDFICHDYACDTATDRPEPVCIGHCLPRQYVCDGIHDCFVSEDEIGCVCNETTQYACPLGGCIPVHKRCDGVVDCKNGLDETYCPCTGFVCDGGRCLPESQVCDYVMQCTDVTDEINCTGCHPYKRLCQENDNKGDEEWCYDATVLCKTGGRCVPERALCNGFWECDDKSDEENCSNVPAIHEYPCPDNKFNASWEIICNKPGRDCGKKDWLLGLCDKGGCRDWFYLPKTNCYKMCPHMRVRNIPCDDGLSCYYSGDKWNGARACSDGTDEKGRANCIGFSRFYGEEEYYHCPGSGDCLLWVSICRENRTCADGAIPPARSCQEICTKRLCPSVCPGDQFTSPFCGGPTDEGVASNCSVDEFTCGSGECVNLAVLCNKRGDCSDYSDEFNCSHMCGPHEFLCKNGQCLSSSYLPCDYNVACADSSDETDEACRTFCRPNICLNGGQCRNVSTGFSCHCKRGWTGNHCQIRIKGTEDYFLCTDKCDTGAIYYRPELVCSEQGLPRRYVCDGIRDCAGNEDELNCVCDEAREYVCLYGGCIPLEKRCDGREDCTFGLDENYCPCTEHVCDVGRCVPESEVCDHVRQCKDGTDELHCKGCKPYKRECDENDNSSGRKWCYDESFLCKSEQRCIARYFVCDGMLDCEDGSDEEQCSEITTNYCGPNAYRCPTERFCKGWDDICKVSSIWCPDGSPIPRRNCPKICERENLLTCADGRGCYPSTRKGYAISTYCLDGSDLMNKTTCPISDAFHCPISKECLRWIRICEENLTCIDGTIPPPRNCSRYCGYGYHTTDICPGKQHCFPWCGGPTDKGMSNDCSAAEFTCGSGECLRLTQVCDRKQDCSDFSDEVNCSHACKPWELLCKNGQCRSVNYKRCDLRVDCFDGSDEDNCFTFCRPNICQNKGICTNITTGFSCQCTKGWTGSHCENKVKVGGFCGRKTCLNGGTCTEAADGFLCHCTDGWTGDRCQDKLTDGASGKRVLITGASSGIGEHLAYEYAKHGASVFITARREERLKQVVSKCRELGAPDAVFGYYVADMKNYRTEGAAFVQEGIKHLGGLDTVIVNHMLVSDFNYSPWLGSDSDIAMFEDMIEVNMKSYVYIVSHALPHLRKNGNGRIGVAGSIAGKVPGALGSSYSAAKFALDGFFSSLRLELSQAESGVSVTYVIIAATDTELMQKSMARFAEMKTFSSSVDTIRSMLVPAADTAYQMMVATERGEPELYYPATVFYIPVKLMVIIRNIFPTFSMSPIPKELYDEYL